MIVYGCYKVKHKKGSKSKYEPRRHKKKKLKQTKRRHSLYLIHEFPAFLHHLLIDHCGLVRLKRLLVGLKGVLHQVDETGAPARISGH